MLRQVTEYGVKDTHEDVSRRRKSTRLPVYGCVGALVGATIVQEFRDDEIHNGPLETVSELARAYGVFRVRNMSATSILGIAA